MDEEVGIIIYPDNDGDGFGVDENPMTSCEVLSGYSITANDCDDSLETGDQDLSVLRRDAMDWTMTAIWKSMKICCRSGI